MLTFPDPNVETEYTDPNGSVWQFNGTGWVRQPDCPDGGGDSGGGSGGDGGGGSATALTKLPVSIMPFTVGPTEASIANTYQGSSPLCWDNDLYLMWNHPTDRTIVQWSRFEITASGTATHQASGTSTVADNRTVNTTSGHTSAVGAWTIRVGEYLFRPTPSAGMTYAKRNADKSLSFGHIGDDLNWDSWYGVALTPKAICPTSDGGLLLGFDGYGGPYAQRWASFAKLGLDGSGNLIKEFQANHIVAPSSGTGVIRRIDLMETPYGYFYGHEALVSGANNFYFGSYDKTLTRISPGSDVTYSYTPKSGTSFMVRLAARNPNNLNFFYVLESGAPTGASAISATAGPVVRSDGAILSSPREINNSHQIWAMTYLKDSDSPTGQNGGWMQPGNGTGLDTNTCGFHPLWMRDQNTDTPETIASRTFSVGVPADVICRTGQIASGRRWFTAAQTNISHSWVNSTNTNLDRRYAVPTGIEDLWCVAATDGTIHFYSAFLDTTYNVFAKVENGKVVSPEVITRKPKAGYMPVVHGGDETLARSLTSPAYEVDEKAGVVIKTDPQSYFDLNEEAIKAYEDSLGDNQ